MISCSLLKVETGLSNTKLRHVISYNLLVNKCVSYQLSIVNANFTYVNVVFQEQLSQRLMLDSAITKCCYCSEGKDHP